MASITYDSFLDDVSTEKGQIASFYTKLENHSRILSFALISKACSVRVILRCGALLHRLDNCENETNAKWQDIDFLNKLKKNLEELNDVFQSLIRLQQEMKILPVFTQIELGLADRIEEKIEMLSVSTDPEIRELVTAIGEKVSH